MKHITLLFSFLIIQFLTTKSFGQDHNVVQLRFGVQNHVPHGLPASLKELFASSSNQFDLILNRRFVINEKYTLNGGLGFTILRFADSNLFWDDTTNQSNYGVVKYGIGRSIYKDKLSINVDIFHYILTHAEKQDDNQKRVFTNLELGVTYNINDRFSISMSSPLTLNSIFSVRGLTGDFFKNETLRTYYSDVRNYGVHLGAGYKF